MNAHHDDDVNMHEKEAQLKDLPYDEQQLQESENEDVGDEDDDESEYSDNQEEDDPDDEDERLLEIACRKIGRNDPNYTDFDCASIRLNDHRAYFLGGALAGNTKLDTLCVAFGGQWPITSCGAQEFVSGVLDSQIKSLTLIGSEELPLEMSQLSTPSIEKFFFEIPIGDEFATQLCESLMASKLLTHLTLPVDQMTPRAAQALSKLLCSSSITNLELTMESGNVATKSIMQTIYLDGVQHSRHIQSLTVRKVLGDMQAFATSLSNLCEFTITDVHLSLSEVELLTQGLSDANQLHKLSLLSCELNKEHMSVLSPALGTHSSIKSVALDYNEIGDEGVAIFVEHWRPASIIKNLSFNSNGIGSKGAELLIKALSHHRILSSLDLSSNILGFDGLKLIGEALPAARVQELLLIDVVNWHACWNLTRAATVIQDAKGMAAYKALLQGVRRNELPNESSDGMPRIHREIDLYLEANACGRGQALELQHSLPTAIWCHFFAKSRMTSSLTFLFLRELPILMIGCDNDKNNNNNIGRKRRRDY